MLLMLTAQGDPVLPNGDFEQADPSNPIKAAHWDLPDGLGIRWDDAPVIAGAPPHGKAIRMDTSVSEIALMASYTKAGLTQWLFPHPNGSAIGLSYGLSLYSDAVPVVPGKTYKIGFDYLADKTTWGIVWMRGYGDVDGKKKRLYDGKVECIGGPAWKHFTGVFHPTKHTPNVTEFKVMLYAYWPLGVAWYDNVTLEAVDEPAPAAPAPDTAPTP